ncbi:MAG: hypothetical protein ACLQDF_02000 [Desulfomonilia bacterium]
MSDEITIDNETADSLGKNKEKPLEDSKESLQTDASPDKGSTVPPHDVRPSSDTVQKESSVDAKQTINIGAIESKKVDFINQKVEAEIHTVLVGDAFPALAIQEFTRSMTVKMSSVIESEINGFCVYDETKMKECMDLLGYHRMILISGEPEIGKRTFARLLALRLREPSEKELWKILISTPLAYQTRVDLLNGIATHSDWKSCILIIDDIFYENNLSLSDFFVSLTQDIALGLAGRLRTNETYIILTADLDSLPHEIRSSKLFGCHVPLPQLKKELLDKGFDRRLEAFCCSQPNLAGSIRKLISDLRDHIIERAKSMPRIRRFFDKYISDVIDGKLTVDQAFDLIDDLSMWFLRDLPRSLESWIFAFTLALAEGHDSFNGVPFVDFCQFYQVLRKFIYEWTADAYDSPRDKSASRLPRPLDELELLEASQTEIVQDSKSPRPMVKFKDKRYGPLLRSVIVNNNRTLSIALVPLLSRIAETDEVMQRIVAARAIGVLGEIDSFHFVRSLVGKWSKMESFQQRALVGHMFQGAWNSSNVNYHRCIEKELEELAGNKDNLWTAIAAYKQIGMVDPEAAFQGLKKIAERNLAQYLEDVPQVVRRFENYERHYRASSSDRESILVVSAYCKLLMDFYQEMFSKENEIATSFQYAMVSLCITVGPEKVFAELKHWVHERLGLGALISLVFLQERGIAAELSKRLIEIPVSSNGRTKRIFCNSVVVAMSGGDKGKVIKDVAEFLESVFEGYYNYFPATKGRFLTQTLFGYLKEWAISAQNGRLYTEAIVDLFSVLLNSINNSLGESIYDWLKNDVDFAQGNLRPIRDAVFDKWQPIV